MKRQRGLTLAEILVGLGILSLLTGLLFSGWRHATLGLTVASERAEMVTQAQVFFAQFEKGLRNSAASSVELQNDPPIASFAIPFETRESGHSEDFEVSLSGGLQFKTYQVLYLDTPSGELRLVELALASPLPTPGLLSQQDLGTGVEPLSHYAVDGRPVARNVLDLDCTFEERVFELWCTLQKGSREPAHFEMSVYLAN